LVIRGVHHSTPDKHVKESLTLLGHMVRFINRPKSRFDKTKIVNLVFVELEQLPYKKDELVQCHRFQDFHYTKINCFLDHNCVRCGRKHAIEACKRDILPVKCVNRGENHTANYKGCIAYQQIVRHRKNLLFQGNTFPQKTFSKRTTVRSNVVGALSYAKVTNGHSRHQNQQGDQTNSLHFEQAIGGLTSNINQMTSHGYGHKPYRRKTNNNTQRPAISQHQRNREKFQNDQQWKRQDQMYLRAEEQFSDLGAWFYKML